jgi:lipoyl(octanoyl) transferase
MTRTCATFGLEARRFPPNTGAWIGDHKVAAIGIKVKKWVSIHGIALNCDNDLSVYDSFVPCGIRDYGVTSLSETTGRRVRIEDAKPIVRQAFEDVFGLSF